MGNSYKQNTTDLRQLFPGNFNRAQKSKPIPGLKPGAFGLLHAWLTDSVYTDGYVIPSLDPLTLRNSHRPRDCRPKEIPPVQETPGV